MPIKVDLNSIGNSGKIFQQPPISNVFSYLRTKDVNDIKVQIVKSQAILQFTHTHIYALIVRDTIS